MRANKTFLFLIAFLCFFRLPAFAQVNESATGSGRHLWVGVEASDFRPDYNFERLYGIGIYGDYYITRRVGVEGEVRFLDFNKPFGQTQKTYLAGPTVNIYHYHQFMAYGKVLAGLGSVTYPYGYGYGSYFAFAFGGGVEYRLNPRFKLRGEYEHESFPAAPGAAITYPRPSNGLTPSGYSGGISYRIF